MILLCKKGAHGVSASREKVCMSLPQKGKGRTIKSHVPFITWQHLKFYVMDNYDRISQPPTSAGDATLQ